MDVNPDVFDAAMCPLGLTPNRLLTYFLLSAAFGLNNSQSDRGKKLGPKCSEFRCQDRALEGLTQPEAGLNPER